MILLVLAVGALAVGATTAPQADRKRTRRWFNRTYREVKDIIQEAGSFARDAFEAAVQEIPRVAERADSRYQEFVAETVEPLLGGERNRQLTAVVSSGKLDVTRDERQLNRYVATSLLSMSAAAVALLLFPPLILLALATALYSTQLIFLGAYRAIRERRMTLDVLGSLYFLGTFAGGFFVAAGFGLFAFYLSEKLVFVTQDRSKKSLVEVFGQQPRTAWVVLDGVEVEAPFESVKAGDSIVVQAGQIVPADGVIVQGIATVDQHKLTGEGQPVEKGVGDPVLAATLMVSGRVHVRVEKTGQETTAAQIGVMLNNTTSFPLMKLP